MSLSYKVHSQIASQEELYPPLTPHPCFVLFLLSHMIKMRFGSDIAMGEGLLLVFKVNL